MTDAHSAKVLDGLITAAAEGDDDVMLGAVRSCLQTLADRMGDGKTINDAADALLCTRRHDDLWKAAPPALKRRCVDAVEFVTRLTNHEPPPDVARHIIIFAFEALQFSEYDATVADRILTDPTPLPGRDEELSVLQLLAAERYETVRIALHQQAKHQVQLRAIAEREHHGDSQLALERFALGELGECADDDTDIH